MDAVAEALTALSQLQAQSQQNMQSALNQQRETMQQFLQHLQSTYAAPVAGPSTAPANPNTALRELSKNIKLQWYYGEKDSAELDTWVFQMEEYFAATPGLGEADKVRFGGVNLRGQAAAWWRDVGKTDKRPATWEAFVSELSRMFMPVARAQVARQKLAGARQRDKESVTSYISYLRRLYLSIPRISEDEKVDRFIRGLSPHLQDKVGDKLDERDEGEQITFEQAAGIAAKIEARQAGRRRTNWRSDRGGETTGPTPMELGAMQGNNGHKGPPGQKDRPKGNGCWHCGEEGHIARHCPKKKNPKGGYGHPKGSSPHQGYNY
jgi:hypothetical protein